ncbi:protein piccolo isoform X2 [Leucoraja erinacea]|uniref:protein piccolo isoform X2 n=1 Tax=Leucoraja erinaceus TaxID=7782 RepID=UPI002458755C|nr:protein piccolo isoform X2 [Leucoraja erinacea]
MMPSFLTEGRPLSAVSSVVNRFGLFDSKAEPEAAAARSQGETPGAAAGGRPEGIPAPAAAPRTAPSAASAPGSRTATPAASAPGTAARAASAPGTAARAAPGPRAATPATSAPRTATPAPGTAPPPKGNLCPVCTSTELRLQEPGSYGRCTECQRLVCIQCGFNPNPHITQVKEWLCLNCQMQRAMGTASAPTPGTKPGTPASVPQVIKQGQAQQKDPTHRVDQAKPLSQTGARKQPLLTKQKSIVASPPQKHKQASHGSPEQQAAQKPKPLRPQQVIPTTAAPAPLQASLGVQQKGSKQTRHTEQAPAQEPAEKQKDSDLRKQPQQLKAKGESAPGKEVVQKEEQARQGQKPSPVVTVSQEKQTAAEPPKHPCPKEEQRKPSQKQAATKPPSSQIPPESQKPPKPPEQSRRFSLNLGGSPQPPPFQPTTPQESVTGKLFGFGASLFSQASTLISTAPSPADQQKPGTKQQSAPPPPTPQKGSKPDTGKGETMPPAAEKPEQKATAATHSTKETGPAATKLTADTPGKVVMPAEGGAGTPAGTSCPLCKTALNIGCKAAPNYNTCTECNTRVCNLCGFNPRPHLTQVVEWLCLTCQTQRALSGQLGDPGKMPPLHPMSTNAPGKQQSPGLPPSKQQHSQKGQPSPSLAKETEQKPAGTSQAAETKDTVPVKPSETAPAVRQGQALVQEAQAPKPGSGEQSQAAQHKQAQLIPEQTGGADKPGAAVPTPGDKVPADEVKEVKAGQTVATTGHSESPPEATNTQTEQVRKPEPVENAKDKVTAEDDKSDSSALLQQRSPQGMSDTGYSSDGISSSLGEITNTLQSEDKDLLKEPVKKDSVSQESSPSSPSDLAKLESTVLSILEAQANTQNNAKPGQYKDPYGLYTEQEREHHRPRTLPITPESYSSDEEDLEDIQEEDEETLENESRAVTLHKTVARESCSSEEAAVRRQRYDSLEDSSESELSPRQHRPRAVSVGSSSSDSHASGDEEEFIRKQIIEMSAGEDESGSDEDEYIRGQLKEIGKKDHPETKGSTAKHRRLSKKSSTSHDDDSGRRHSWHDDDDDEVYDASPEAKYRETKSQENEEMSVSAGGGLRRFKTIDLNSSIANKYTEDSEKKDEMYYDEEPELEMESLTDSPEDRSRGEGSSSLHATSSFTPGTSPTSVSSLDEDSDSSPSHKKVLEESKQQRKARHRSHGPLLPTIEDSSEEEELREEEELLREQEKQRELEQQQRKSSTKKSKKDKDELRAQRRRERPKTPPSNLSPIEDASPTEELRQAAEMEELHRSSCSEYSPSIESESEGFEISPEKIIEVQKVYKLPTSVLLHSPTDDKSGNIMEDAIGQKSLKSADEAYEQMMQKAKLLQNQKGADEVFEKEPLYGGMLIEDYIYQSLVEDTYNGTADNRDLHSGQHPAAGLFQDGEKKLRSPDEIYEEIMRRSPGYSDARQSRQTQASVGNIQRQQVTTVQPGRQTIITHSSGAAETSPNMDRQLLDADAAYEELMKRQRALLTPGTSPTQPCSPLSPVTTDADHIPGATFPPASSSMGYDAMTSMPHSDAGVTQTVVTGSVVHSIPDVRITQHFTEEDIETEFPDYGADERPEMVKQSKPETTVISVAPSSTTPAISTCTIPSTITTTGVSLVSHTVPALATDLVAVGKATSEERATVAPTCTTARVTMSPVTGVVGRTSHVHPVPVSAPVDPANKSHHVVISVPPGQDSSQTPTSTLTSSPQVRPSTAANHYAKVGPSVSVTICGSSGVTQPASKAMSLSIRSGDGKLTTASTTASISCSTAQQVPYTTAWDCTAGSFITRPALYTAMGTPLPPPPPPLPPLMFPKPFAIPRKPCMPQVPICGMGYPIYAGVRTGVSNSVNQSSVLADSRFYHPPPPPVPPKPANIPSAMVFPTRPTDGIRPAIPPKPSLSHLPLTEHKPGELLHKPPSSTATLSLKLTSPGDFRPTSPTSPLSPYSNRASPKLTLHSQATYVVITLPSEPGTPTESITCQASPAHLCTTSTKSPALAPLPSTLSLAHFTQSLERKEIVEKGKTETVYFYQSLAQGVISTVAREMPAEATQVPVLYNTSVSISIPPNDKYPETSRLQGTDSSLDQGPSANDVIDLRTLTSLDSAMTTKGMDLSTLPADGRRQGSAVDAGTGRLTTVVQPNIVNLSTVAAAEQVAGCRTVVGSAFTAEPCEGQVDLVHAASLPLQLTARLDAVPTTRGPAAGVGVAEVPINLTCSSTAPVQGWSVPTPLTLAPTGTTNGWTDGDVPEIAAVDLSTTKPQRMMVSLDEATSGIVTAVVGVDDRPVDLTAGRQSVCCDVVYKLPFGRTCSSLEPASVLPEDRYGYRDDHYTYDRNGSRGLGNMKPSMSDTNLAEAGVFQYRTKYNFNAADAAVDLTAGKLTPGELMDYSAVCTQPHEHLSQGALSYPETRQLIAGTSPLPQYSQARLIATMGGHHGMPSVLRSSGGVVYSSVATPIPSTFAITTQPGSIFSHSLGLHGSESGLLGLDTATFQPAGSDPLQSGPHIAATYPESAGAPYLHEADYLQDPDIDPTTIPQLSPLTSPGSEENKHLLMEREMLEFEKMKQIRLAEELERERHEIQIFREQEKMIVQRELQELQTMKQQLLFQQEEERQAQFMMQQETIAQQQIQLEQIQQLQHQLQQQLEEQKIRQIYQIYDSPTTQTTSTSAESGAFWQTQDSNVSPLMSHDVPQSQPWYDGVPQHTPRHCLLSSVSEMSLKDIDAREGRQLRKRSSMPRLRATDSPEESLQDSKSYKKIVDSGVQTDDEEATERSYATRRRRSKKSVDSCVQTDDEDNAEEWDIPNRRRKSRVGKYTDSSAEVDKTKRLHFAKFSNISVQTVAEISVQTEPEGIIKTPSIRARIDSKVEIVKHISAPEKTYRGESLGCQTEGDSNGQSPPYLSSTVVGTISPPKPDKKRPTPLEIGYANHLRADSSFQVVHSPPKSPQVLYSPLSPMSPNKGLETTFQPADIISQKLAAPDVSMTQPLSPRTIKVMQRSMSDPKPLSPTAEENSRLHFQYSDSYATKSSQSVTPVGTQKKVKRTLPNPPPEEAGAALSPATYSSVGSASRRRVCRTTTMARAKILQDIDRELELVERESSKLRKKQAELDEEEKEIDAKLRYLELGINRRKEALLKEREKRERAYLQGVAEERDYMSDSEVSNIRDTRMDGQHGMERPRTAPQSDYDQFISSQTQSQPQYATTPHYTQYQYSSSTPTLPQTQFQQQGLYHQQVSPYQTQPSYQTVPTNSYQQSPPSQGQSTAYPHSSQVGMIQQKPRQTALVELEPKITTNYEVIHNQPVLMASTATGTTYAVPHLSNTYSSLDLRIGLDERGTLASSPMSSISADSYYTDIEPHEPRNYILIDDIGELTKGPSSLPPGFNLHNIQKEVQKSERLLRASEARRATDVKDFLGTLQSRLHSYGKAEEDSMEDPYELKLLKQQIKQEFRRGTEGLEHISGLPHYYHGDSSYRHFAKAEKYSISRLTLEKQAAKQLPPSFIYQKQSKHKKQLLDPQIAKFLPIQEARDVEAEYASYMGSTPSVTGVSSRARLIQDDITFGLRKNIREQQKFLGTAIRSTLDEEIDKAYMSGTRSRPPSVYGLDLSLKRDPSSTSLQIKSQENDPLDMAFTHSTPSGRTKPSSLPISHSRGRIPIVAQNSEEESPLSPVGQPMGMARAAAGPLPPISADTREQFGSSHSLPEVQQHMREESRTRAYDRDIAFIMDDFQHAMSDSEAYHLRREETDWFDKPRESRLEDVPAALNRKVPDKLTHSRPSQSQSAEISGKPVQYNFPHSRVKVQRDVKDQTISGNGLGIKIIGGKEIPVQNGEIGAYIAKVVPGGSAEQTGKLTEGMQVLEWNGIPLTGKTYEEVQCIIGVPAREAEICVRLGLNMLSDSEKLQHLDLKDRTKAVEKQRSPGVDPKQLAAELQKVSQQASCVVSSAIEKGAHSHSGTTSAASSAAPSPGQPASPSISKKRHSSKPLETASKLHPITGEIQLQMNYDKQVGNLVVHVLQARDLAPRDNNGYSDPFVKVYLLPGRGQVMVVQNASVENKHRTKPVQKSLNPEWNQTVIYKNISMDQLKKKTLEVTVWDYDRISSNDFLGEVLIDLANAPHFDNTLRWYQLKEQTESIDHVRSHSGQASQQLPKSSVIKSRSHGIFPDPSKEMHVATIEKSQSSPASSKSSSEGHLRSHGPSRSQSKGSVTQSHLEDAGAAIAAAEAAVHQLRVQPTHKSGQAQNHAKKHRHSIAGVPIQRTQSDNLPSPAIENKDQSQLAIRKVMSVGPPKAEGAKSTNHRVTESSISTTSSVSSGGSGYSVDSEGSTTTGDGSVFTDTPTCKISQDAEIKEEKHKASEPFTQALGPAETNGKTQVMGEIKIALKKEMKTDGEQLLVEILQCRNITYKFKSPDHLPDLYVKLYVINISTQKRVFKKKTRICRHDREPSFNETFRFSLSPAGHSLQILLISNGGKFMRKTLIGEAYIWLDKVDLRKRVVNWHKLLVSSTESQRAVTSGFNV